MRTSILAISKRRAWAATAALLVALVASCTRAPQPAEGLGAEGLERAAELHARLDAQAAAGDLEAAGATARELLSLYPAYPRADEVVFSAGTVAAGRGSPEDAARYFQQIEAHYPDSPLRDDALLGLGRAWRALDSPYRSADALLTLLESPIAPEMRDAAIVELRTIVRTELGSQQLAELAKRHPSSPLSREMALELARRAYANGDYDETYRLLAGFLYEFPEEEGASEARRLLTLASERRGAPVAGPPTQVDPNAIGLVLPITGQLSAYGRLFEQGVRLAVEEGAGAGRTVRVVTADSKGTAVGAVKAVRRLALEEGAVVLIGSVFTVPTMAAAIEANAWRVPLLSPVVSAEEMTEIGPWVFQTRVPLGVEATAMAELAVSTLLFERLAVIAPARGEGRELGDVFAAEVRRRGMSIVAVGYYDEGATDFREALEAVREGSPDAIFAPGTVEELLNLVPQIRFYDLQAPLLGLSNWNSERLMRLSGRELEGALFPAEIYRGKDPQALRRFEAMMLGKGETEPSPLTAAGYFGTELVLQGLAAGAVSRDEVAAFLTAELRGGADARMAEAVSLPILTVHGGRVRPFQRPDSPR
ncbi:MAG: ABC transporter substrate-binding protein [Candidatus Krumholzibacteria bacterium]|nr:ABC transporter substrate-binding protein [Candidatus Krumholzibacteria bacterium]